MTRYLEKKDSAGNTYCIDKIVLKGTLKHEETQSLSKIAGAISKHDGIEMYEQKPRTALFSYFVQMEFTDLMDTQKEMNVVFQWGLNTHSKRKNEFKLTFNPSKCDMNLLYYILNVIQSNAKNINIDEIDIAQDIPIEREQLCLYKDRRLYGETRNSFSDQTQYLGRRHANGFVKLYNKQIESNLAEPLTRLEITLKALEGAKITSDQYKKAYPTVYNLPRQLPMMQKTTPEEFITSICLQYPDEINNIKRLDWRTQKKIEQALEQLAPTLTFDQKIISEILSQLYREMSIYHETTVPSARYELLQLNPFAVEAL